VDFSIDDDVINGVQVYINEGDTYSAGVFVLNNTGAITLGTTLLVFSNVSTVQLTIATSSNFSSSDLISGLSQNGRHVIIDNGSSNIVVDIDVNITASYQVVGTGTVTFTASTSTLQAPSGDIINSQYGSAAVSYFSTNKIVLVNNV
jgi:hypothetical protein